MSGLNGSAMDTQSSSIADSATASPVKAHKQLLHTVAHQPFKRVVSTQHVTTTGPEHQRVDQTIVQHAPSNPSTLVVVFESLNAQVNT